MSSTGLKPVKWDEEEEALYQANIADAKRLFMSEVPIGKFRDIGMKEVYLDIRKQGNLHNLRNFLLEKAQEGEWLSDSERNYLTYSSGLTHAVIPKDEYKQAIKTISPEVKSDLITSIAEDILAEYAHIMRSIIQARRKYLGLKNGSHRGKAESYLKKLKLENESLVRVVGLKKWRQVNWRYCVKRLDIIEENKLQAQKKTSVMRNLSPQEQRLKEDKDNVRRMIQERKEASRNKFLKRNYSKPVNSNYLGLVP